MTAADFIFHSGLTDVPAALRGGVVAIGNFDGVHRGHGTVLSTALEAASREGCPSVALTFEPHPRSFFRPDQPIPRLTPPPEKRFLIARSGVTGMVELSFDGALASVSAEEFVTDVLIGALGVREAVVGWDFHFGKGRGGSPGFLVDAGKRFGFGVTVVSAFGGEVPVSSSAIRACLSAGDVAGANALLGYRWFAMGEVVKGDQRGRHLGYPTANVVLPTETPLAHGIYAVRVLVDGKVFGGVANFGRRPQFHDNAPPVLEPHIFDFSGDLYGKRIGVEFLARLRGEERFESVDALIRQMDLDSAKARALIAAPNEVSSAFI